MGTTTLRWMRSLAAVTAAVAVVLACAMAASALAPATAHAEGKASVWVVTKQKIKSSSDGDAYTSTYSYYANGLLKVANDSGYKTTYKYDKKNRLKSNAVKNGKYSWKTTYKVDGKDRVVKATPSDNPYKSTFTYNAKGQLTKKTGFLGWTRYYYDAKGQVKMAKEDNAESGKATYTYKYDKKGNVIESYCGKELDWRYKNTYKNGNLVKAVAYWGSADKADSTYTYSYKKIQVPKSLVKYVKAQQKVLISKNLDNVEAAHK